VIESVEGTQKVSHIRVRNVKTGVISKVDCGAVFVFVGFVPNSKLTRTPLRMDENGYIITGREHGDFHTRHLCLW